MWRSVFEPGTNKKLSSNLTRDFYDHVPPAGTSPTTWEYIVRWARMLVLPAGWCCRPAGAAGRLVLPAGWSCRCCRGIRLSQAGSAGCWALHAS